MQSWNEVRLGLMALGYNRILHVELVCKSCGTWRGAIREEAEFYSCPQCTSRRTLPMAVEGFSRHDLPEWQLIVKPLSDKARQMIMVEDLLEDRAGILRNKRMRQHATTFARQAFKRGRGLSGSGRCQVGCSLAFANCGQAIPWCHSAGIVVKRQETREVD